MTRFLALSVVISWPALALTAEPVDAEFFEKKVRPVLAEHCFACHSASVKEPKSGLRLDSRAGLLQGGARGPAVVPGDTDKSLLIRVISYTDTDLQMPPRAKLSDAAIADLKRWVQGGAPWPGGNAVVAEKRTSFDVMKRKAEHWCWQPVRATPPPAVKDSTWPLTAADRFILAKLEAASLQPAPPVNPNAWLRRVYFDLIGLPPTPQEIEAFERDVKAAPHVAMAKVVDRLLASPQFGERWGRHWLDLVRYAETMGHEFDPIIPNAYQYRDYVIRAFNADVPYNQFVTEHIAGDLMPNPRLDPRDGFNESVLGTGFWFLGEEVHSPVDIRSDECDRIDNKIDVFSKTFLALTVSCARCHDHKFDAISQKDYYALSGFLLSSAYQQVRFDSKDWNDRINRELAKIGSGLQYEVMGVLSELVEPGARQLKENMLAARAAILMGKDGETDIVRAWVKYLKAAAKDPADPFHFWAVLCSVGDDQFGERIKAMTAAWNQQASASEASLNRASLIAASDPSWYSGMKTSRPGWTADMDGFDCHSMIWGNHPDRPILRFRDERAWEREPTWPAPTVTPETESDHGVLGPVTRTGQVFRSPKFSLTTGKVYVRVKGRGRIYAAVDSHKLIAGPLHGRLVRDFDTGKKWQWVQHDLTPYKGHRLHIEVSPADNADFGIDQLVQSESSPIESPQSPLPWRMPWAQKDPVPTTPEQTADYFVRWFQLNLVSNEGWDTAMRTTLSNIPLDHPELFGIRDFSRLHAITKPILEKRAQLLAKIRRESRLAPAMCDVGAVNERVHIRGSYKSLGEVVPRRFLEALAGPKGIDSQQSGRDILAKQMTDPAINPLIARVLVNRVWHHLFGRGIVATVDNFGALGEQPTHPDLLDFLADRFVKQGWSVKTLIRELVLSQTYRMSSVAPQAVDEENKLFHRANLRRLQGEAIRDAMLAVAGRLDPTLYGKPVPVHLTEFLDGRGRPGASGPLDGNGRRSIYTAVRRNFLPPFMLTFDTPTPFSTVGRRSVSNVPAQALILMNDPFVHQQAERWGRRVVEQPGDVETKIRHMYVSAFARPPSAEELKRSQAFIDARGANDAKAWGELAHVLFNVKEFIYLP